MPKTSTTAHQLPAADGDGSASNRTDASSVAQICLELEDVGVEPMLPVIDKGLLTTGVTLAVDAGTVLTFAPAMEQFRERVFDVLTSGLPLSVGIKGLGPEPWAATRFGHLCEVLCSIASTVQVNPASIEIVIDADTLTPEIAWLKRRELLGNGPVYLLAGVTQMRAHGGRSARDRHDRYWLQLWCLREGALVRTAYAPMVTPQCPLLCTEAASAILPSIGIQVPEGSAWVTMKLNIARFADDRGSLHQNALQKALHCCVDLGDALHDHVMWPTVRMRHDSWLNRRLAIVLTGLGDLARQRRLDPQQFACLQNLGDVLRWTQSILRSRSHYLAVQNENLPALDLCDPSHTLPGGRARDGWRERWHRAVELNAIRHRNLIVLSPWSMFPEHSPADPRYCDLLPLLEFADACAFPGPPPLGHWNINQFKILHQRAWAVLELKEAHQLIAEPV
ncbi:MAG: hypothetical protein IIA07_03205 [Proteobacteria bacterium]|nr:hypothetical protein [Pseudomonadota bacterium]